MAAKVNLKGFDNLVKNALKKVDHRIPTPFSKWTEEGKQKFENTGLKKLSKNYLYRVDGCYGSKSLFKLKVTRDNFSTDDLKG